VCLGAGLDHLRAGAPGVSEPHPDCARPVPLYDDCRRFGAGAAGPAAPTAGVPAEHPTAQAAEDLRTENRRHGGAGPNSARRCHLNYRGPSMSAMPSPGGPDHAGHVRRVASRTIRRSTSCRCNQSASGQPGMACSHEPEPSRRGRRGDFGHAGHGHQLHSEPAWAHGSEVRAVVMLSLGQPAAAALMIGKPGRCAGGTERWRASRTNRRPAAVTLGKRSSGTRRVAVFRNST
jgi:hypothetical protein